MRRIKWGIYSVQNKTMSPKPQLTSILMICLIVLERSVSWETSLEPVSKLFEYDYMEGHGMDETYLDLWYAVLKQAIVDVSKYPVGYYSEKALSWVEDECEEVGSFQWICSILNLNPEPIKIFIYQRISEGFSTAIHHHDARGRSMKRKMPSLFPLTLSLSSGRGN